MNRLPIFALLLGATVLVSCRNAAAQDLALPRLERAGDRYTLMVDGAPFFPLGAQVGNSSGWPDRLQTLWPKAEAMHLNTLEVPVYWEQMEPRDGVFDDTVVDAVLAQAREHHVRLALLWFGTWKNGKDHYAPEWVKRDLERFPRMVTRDGRQLDVLSANATSTRQADATAFTHLMHHLRSVDAQHTVILVQVENESGALGSVRDFSPAAEKQFAEPVPSALTRALHKPSGTWKQVFGEDADETFQAWSVASYVNAVAEAGKRELALPMYVNNWLKSPRGFPILTVPGEDYPSGGPTWNMFGVWKAAAPALDFLAPDIYVPNTERYRVVLNQFHVPGNALFVPETLGFGSFPGSQGAARNLFLAIGSGAIGFAPFGLDSFSLEENGKPDLEERGLADNYALLGGMDRALARLQFEGKIQTSVEEPGLSAAELTFGPPGVQLWSAQITYPPSYTESADTSGLSPTAALRMGRVLVAQLGPNEFLVAGIDARVRFRQTPPNGKKQTGFLRVEEGEYDGTAWRPKRLWNGDETDAGLNFKSPGSVLHVTLETY